MLPCMLIGQSYAGSMGQVDAASRSGFTPFIGLEGDVTWNNTEAATIFNKAPSVTYQRWGGRGSLGVTHPFRNNFSLSSEMGWGYYGHTKSTNAGVSPGGIASLSVTNNSDIYGFDLLVGAMYNYNQTDLFVKVGAMAENRRFRGDVNSSVVTSTFSRASSFSVSNTQTNVYPEIKAGGIYNVNENLGLTLAYMHVFGENSLNSTVHGTYPNTTTTPTTLNSSASIGDPSLNSILFGVVYSFA